MKKMSSKNLQLIKKKKELTELEKKRERLFKYKSHNKEENLFQNNFTRSLWITSIIFFSMPFIGFIILKPFDSSYADNLNIIFVLSVPGIIGGFIYLYIFFKICFIARIKKKLRKIKKKKYKLTHEINEIVSRDLIDEGDREFNKGDYFLALKSYKKAQSLKGISNKTQQEITNRSEIINNKLNDFKKRDFMLFIENGNELIKKELWVNAINEYNKALNIAREIKIINPRRVKDLKNKIDSSYEGRINSLMDAVDKLLSQELFQKARESVKDVLNLSKNILNYSRKNRIQLKIREKIDLINIKIAVQKIHTGKKLKIENKIEKSIKVFEKAQNIIDEISNRDIRQELKREIRALITN